MIMTDVQPIRFTFSKIVTDEFALLPEGYAPSIGATMKIALGFAGKTEDRSIGIQAKCMFYQEEKLLLVIAVSCWFKIAEEDWITLYKEENKTFLLPRAHALHLASITVSTARGVLHAKTENQVMNTLIVPPINLNEIIKEDITLSVNATVQDSSF
jgi:hypothetical protein